MTLRSDGLIANLDLMGQTYSRSIDIARDTASDTLSFTRGTGAAPTFYELLQYDVPSDIFQMQPISARGMTVSRVFESVDESRGIDTDGDWIMTTPVTDSIFQKGQLYRVRLTVTPPPTSGVSYYLTLEDFVP